jgi:hypothetical protein
LRKENNNKQNNINRSFHRKVESPKNNKTKQLKKTPRTKTNKQAKPTYTKFSKILLKIKAPNGKPERS